MKKKYSHQKLIRDKIPEHIKASGNEYKIRILDKTDFEKELKKKLLEESREVIDAPKKSLLNELADVLEVTKSIASHYKISFNEVEEFQIEKRKRRGGFKKKLFLMWSTGKAGK